MVIRDVSSRYVGTLGGVTWAIIHPLATVGIYWFVFSVGFKAQGPGQMPFVLYFASGLIPWLFFSEALISGIQAVIGNAHLIKKTVFPAEVLPVVQLIAASYPHSIMLIALLALAWMYGYSPSFALVQVIYYYGVLACLILGLCWLFGSLQVFHRDVGQGISVVLGLWFWLTPIVWSTEIIPPGFISILQYNPMYYVVEGYRASFVMDRPVFIDWNGGLRFWAVTGPIFVVGAYVFRRLKPEFAEVL